MEFKVHSRNIVKTKTSYRNMQFRNSIDILTDEKIFYEEQFDLMSSRITTLTKDINKLDEDLQKLEGTAIRVESLNDMIKNTVISENKFSDNESVCSDVRVPAGTGATVKIKASTFKGEVGEKPLQFLSDLKKYVEKYKDDDIKTLINQCLSKFAKNWFYLIEDQITSYENFEELFRTRFWSNSIKDGLRRTLNSGAYIENGNLSRVNYATKMFGIAEDLKIAEDESTIIDIVVQHFGVEIKRLVRLQKIKMKNDLFDILQENDIDDQILRSNRKRYESNSRNTENNRRNSGASDYDNNDNNNYQQQYNFRNDKRFENSSYTKNESDQENSKKFNENTKSKIQSNYQNEGVKSPYNLRSRNQGQNQSFGNIQNRKNTQKSYNQQQSNLNQITTEVVIDSTEENFERSKND